MSSSRSNLLFIMPDQLRPDFLSCYGADFINTPHIDSIATNGVRYAKACSPSPLCVPMRSALLTGVNAIRTGVMSNDQYLRPDIADCGMRTWPEMLNAAGYMTCAVGKMHFYPWEAPMGFQNRIICEDKRWIHVEDDYDKYLRSKGLRKLHGNEHDGYLENRGAIVHQHAYEDSWDGFVGNEAVRWIREYEGEKPFAMMVGFPGPHCPYDPSPEYADLFSPDDMPDPFPAASNQPTSFREDNIKQYLGPWNGIDYTEFTTAHKKKIRAHYASLVKQIDDKVGAILEVLRETGHYESTVIIFGSDHGDYLGDHGLIGKGTYYESSTKVPLLVQGPDIRTGHVHKGPASLEDVTATLLHFGGCDIPAYMDSRALADLGISGSSARVNVFGFLASGCMSYDGTWKLAKYDNAAAMLFNIERDPKEQNNLIEDPECQGVSHRLDSELTSEILRSITRAHADKNHDTGWEDMAFAQGGGNWNRRYPQPLTETTG